MSAAAKIAAKHKARGWKVIPIPPGAKGLQIKEWQTRTYDIQEFKDGYNVGVQMGPVSNGLTDIDLDCREAIALAPYFLPETNAIFGRASKPKSHYLYVTPDPYPKAFTKLVDDNLKTIVELRMGGGGKGAQSVFPGSVHETGEKIEWAEEGEPAATTCALLLEGVKKIAVGSLMVRHWPAGGRHDASLRCGGFLARAGWDPDTIDYFMRGVLMVAGIHEHSRVEDSCRSARDAAEKYLEEGKGFGLPALKGVFGEAVGKAIANILQYNEVDTNDVLERMNEKYFVVNMRGKARVGTFTFDPILNRQAAEFHSVPDFKILEDHPRIPGRDKNGKAVKFGRGTWWLNNPFRQQYAGIVFDPGGAKVISNKLNLWQGWGIEPKQGCWPLLRKHMLEVLVNNDAKHFEFLEFWTAWCFQNPALMAEVALVLRGDQGTGKGVYGRALRQAFGQHALQISSHHQLTGRFNAHMMDCAMLFADEAFWPGDKSAEGQFKRIISEDTLSIEFKNIDVIQCRNTLKLIMASNADWVVPASIDDRRCAVFDVSNKYVGKSDYFNPLYAEIANGGIAAMMWDLMQMDLNGWHPRYNVPKTAALLNQKYRSLPPELQWWVGLLMAGELPGPSNPANPRLALSWSLLRHAQRTVPAFRFLSDSRLGILLKELGCNRDADYRINGKRAWHFPVLAEARKAWAARIGAVPDWEKADEWGHVPEDYPDPM